MIPTVFDAVKSPLRRDYFGLKELSETQSTSGARIRLSTSRWEHITRRHPEVARYRERLLDTIRKPDLICLGRIGELKAAKKLEDTHFRGRHLIVVYRETSKEEEFIITSYITSDIEAISRRGVVWRRS